MSIRVKVNAGSTITAKITGSAEAGLSIAGAPVSVAQNNRRIDNMRDVDASGEVENSTLVYDAETDTYVVKEMDLDGGSF